MNFPGFFHSNAFSWHLFEIISLLCSWAGLLSTYIWILIHATRSNQFLYIDHPWLPVDYNFAETWTVFFYRNINLFILDKLNLKLCISKKIGSASASSILTTNYSLLIYKTINFIFILNCYTWLYYGFSTGCLTSC